MRGEESFAAEQYFLIEAGEETRSRQGWTPHEVEIMTEHKWWSMDELKQTELPVWPANIVEMIQSAKAG